MPNDLPTGRDRLIEAMAIDVSRKWNAGIPVRRIMAELIVEIPEIAEGLQLREEKLERERKMRGGLGE